MNEKINAEVEKLTNKLNKIIELENEQLKLIDKDVFAIDENGWTNKEKWWAINDEINELERKCIQCNYDVPNGTKFCDSCWSD